MPSGSLDVGDLDSDPSYLRRAYGVEHEEARMGLAGASSGVLG